MQNKKIPLRMCIACKESKPKKDLIRITNKDDKFILDSSFNAGGRGCYVCNKKSCIDLVLKNKLLHKTFKQNVSNDVYNLLKECIVDNN